jgi:hypothetical protein
MSWRDERIGLQVERALADIRLTQGCEVEVLVREGQLVLIAQLGLDSELDAILRALATVPGVRGIGIDVAITKPILVSRSGAWNRGADNGAGRCRGLN